MLARGAGGRGTRGGGAPPTPPPPGATRGAGGARRRGGAVPSRPFLDLVETTATEGKGILRCFRGVLVAACDHGLPAASPAAGPEEGEDARRRFLAALDASLPSSPDAAPLSAAAPRRSLTISGVVSEPDAAGLETALEASRWLAVRDLDVRDLQRERALGRLLLDLGHLCASATDIEAVTRSVLATLVMNLDAVTGWAGMPEATGGERVYDPMGPCLEGSAVAETAHFLAVGLPDGRLAPVGAAATAGFPGGAAGGEGLFQSFSVGGGRRAWMLLVGPPARGLPPDAAAVLAPAGAFLGLTVARLSALLQLRASNVMLEQKVEERTLELRREKETLEVRVRDRTRELEEAKRATLDAERRLLDRERTEGVHRLAAGLAHELNNPVGAIRANLEFLREGVERLRAGPPSPEDVGELAAALDDAWRDVERVTASTRALFGEAASSRRAARGAPLAPAVRAALRSYAQAVPRSRSPKLLEREVVAVGVPPAECARWVFRLLTALGPAAAAAVVAVGGGEAGPELRVSVDGDHPAGPAPAFAGVGQEVSRAGGRLEARSAGRRTLIRVAFPRALGEAQPAPAARAAS